MWIVALVILGGLLAIGIELLIAADEINRHIDRCADQSHDAYIWDEIERQNSCRR